MLNKFLRVNAAQAKLLRADKEIVRILGAQSVLQDQDTETILYCYKVCQDAYFEVLEVTQNFDFKNGKLMRNVQILHNYSDLFRKELTNRGIEDPGTLMD